jgi:TusA-related sulfurtransferase
VNLSQKLYIGLIKKMATQVLDATGLKCPQPIIKLSQKVPQMKPGDILEVLADCATFEADVKTWCTRMKKVLLAVKNEGGNKKRAQIKF